MFKSFPFIRADHHHDRSFTMHDDGMSRHGGGRHHRGGRFGRRGFGEDGLPRARKLSASDLQLVLLALLEQKPAHGYEMIRQLEEISGGFYTPSPGMIYPALTYLDELEHTSNTAEGNRKLYTLTEVGRAYLDEHRQDADQILDALRRIGTRMNDVRDAFSGINTTDPDSTDELHRARRALKGAMVRKRNADPAERQRIAKILMTAAEAILQSGS